MSCWSMSCQSMGCHCTQSNNTESKDEQNGGWVTLARMTLAQSEEPPARWLPPPHPAWLRVGRSRGLLTEEAYFALLAFILMSFTLMSFAQMSRKFHSTKIAKWVTLAGRDISANDISGGQSRWLLTEEAYFTLMSLALMSFAQMSLCPNVTQPKWPSEWH